MFENNVKFPKFFICMQIALSLIILIGMFFSVKFVACVYFVALIISAVFVMLDKKYGSILTNYKLTFFLFDLINLIGVIAILYYEYAKHTKILNVFLILVLVVECLMMIVDFVLIKNENLSNNENFLADIIKLCSMICLLTYFCNVSDLYFSIVAFVFELIAFGMRMYINRPSNITKIKEEKFEKIIVKRIRSAGENEGDVE